MLPQSELPHDIATCGRHQGWNESPIERVSVHVCHGASLGHMLSEKRMAYARMCVCVSMCVCMGVCVYVCVCVYACVRAMLVPSAGWGMCGFGHTCTQYSSCYLSHVIALIWAIPTFCALPNRWKWLQDDCWQPDSNSNFPVFATLAPDAFYNSWLFNKIKSWKALKQNGIDHI